METEKSQESEVKLVKLRDAINLINQQVNLLGIVLDQTQPKRCPNTNGKKDWVTTLRIIDDSYQSPGLTVNVFSNKLQDLPHINTPSDIILFLNLKIKSFDAGEGVNAVYDKRVSSFALYKRGTGEDFVCYKCTSNFHGGERHKSFINELAKLFAQALPSSSSGKRKTQTMEFSFLREIKEGKHFNLLCKIIHVNEDLSTIFVWDGSDAPPASIGIDDESFSNLSVHTLLSRDILLSIPTVGTVLRVSTSNHLFHGVKPGDWVKLCHLLCVVDKGSWIGKVTDSTMVSHAQDDPLVEKIVRIHDKRITSKMGHIPFWCFPSPPGLTEIDDDQAPFVTLMDIITSSKVTCKHRCIVRVVAASPSQVEELSSDKNRVVLTLEDPTAALEASLCDKDAEYFWGEWFENTEMLGKKWDQLLGIERESSVSVATRNPPWIECCTVSYDTNEADLGKTRSYNICGTRLC